MISAVCRKCHLRNLLLTKVKKSVSNTRLCTFKTTVKKNAFAEIE